MAKRVLLGKEGSNYVLKVSKPTVDVIDDTINDRDYLFNSEMYRAGVIRSNSTYTSMTTSGVDLPTTSDSSNNAYIPAFIISEKGAFYPQARFDEQYGSGGTSGGNIRGRIVNALNTAAGGGLFQFSLNASGTTKNKVIPYFVDIDGMTDPRPGEGSGTYPFFGARSRASSDGDVKIQILGIPCQFGKMTNSATLFGNSVLTGTNSGEGGSSGGGGTASAPTVTGTSRTARNNTNDTVAVAASAGSGNSGTITYAQGSSNSASGLSFQSSNSFNHPRGTTRYYFAKQSNLVSTTVGTNHVHVSAAVDITPSGFNNLVATAASGAAGTAQYTIAGLGTGDTASVSTSAGSVSASSGVNGTTITFSLNATGGGGNLTSANITVGATTKTFVVTTATDNTPTFNPSDFTNTGTGTSGVNQGATVTSNAITVGGINVGLSVSVSGCTVSIAGGSFVSSGTVTNGQTVTIRSTASSTFGAALNPSVTIGSTTINQTVTTRTAVTAGAPTSMTATQSTNTNANTQTVTCAASGGSGTLQFSNDNSNWGTGTTFTQTRNTTVTYYARRTAEAGASSAISVTEFVPPLFVIGSYSNTATVSASGNTISSASSGTQSYINIFNIGAQYGTVSLSASATTNPSSMLSSVAINSIGTVTGTVASNSGSARTGTITVSGTTSQGGTPSSQTFNVPQAAAASNLWEVGITMGGGNTGSGYSGFFAFHGSTTDASCDLFSDTPAWRFYDVPQSSTNTFFWVNGIRSNSGWTTLKIYNGTSASGTLLATVARTSCTHANPFFTGSTSWTLPADYTAASGNRYLVFT
ncbi:hypothetical protein N9992_00585 [bacterium]|nr:hypothetical protein [bacterium]